MINGYEVEHDFPGIGRKTILLNAREIFREKVGSRIILLAMEDITERKRLETEIQDAREYAENIVETVREPLVVAEPRPEDPDRQPQLLRDLPGDPRGRPSAISSTTSATGSGTFPKLRVLVRGHPPP